jgi:hypothetical protein
MDEYRVNQARGPLRLPVLNETDRNLSQLVQKMLLSQKGRSQRCSTLSIFSKPIQMAVCFGAVRQKPWWLPRRALTNWRSLPPVSILSSINTRATKFASRCQILQHKPVRSNTYVKFRNGPIPLLPQSLDAINHVSRMVTVWWHYPAESPSQRTPKWCGSKENASRAGLVPNARGSSILQRYPLARP